MSKKRQFVYTNVGFRPDQHRTLKHLAVEERADMADLVRDAVDLLVEKKRRARGRRAADFLARLGRGWVAREERAYNPAEWSQTDRDLYGPGPAA